MDGTCQLNELREQVEAKRLSIELAALQRIEESWASFSQYVDPIDAVRDDRTGDLWVPVTAAGGDQDAQSLTTGVQTEAQLHQIRQHCRQLAVENPHAQTIVENCVSFVVGTGILYQATLKPSAPFESEAAVKVQSVLDRWIKQNCWYERQEECMVRLVRDGEAFLRLFPLDGDLPAIRFVEPGLVADPRGAAEGIRSFGVETDPDDVETVVRYWIAGKPVDASLIQHRKIGVDRNVKRGMPLLWSIRRECKRAEATRRNMAIVYGAQTAIAGVRKHAAKASEVDVMIGAGSQLTRSNPTTGKQSSYNFVPPGTILDVPQGMEFEFASAKVNVAAGKEVVQADLRAAGARLCMPEYMVSGDASNANMASTMVAESPGVRYYERRQARMIEADLELLDKVIQVAVKLGLLSDEEAASVSIEATAPTLAVRNRESEARANQIEHQEGVLSRRTWRQRLGLDDDTEEANFATERESAMEFQTQLGLPPQLARGDD